MNKDAIMQQRAAVEQKHFDDFMTAPTTKLLLSLIQASDHPEAMKTLLRSAFDCGVGSGSGGVLLSLITAMTQKPDGKS